MDIKELASGADPAVHWYYQTKQLPLLAAFRHATVENPSWHVLDVGAGSGFFSCALARKFPACLGHLTLVDPAYRDDELGGHEGVTRTRALPATIENTFVILMDVLEHLPDEIALLRSIQRRCRGTNRFFVTVPAFQALWSYHDVHLGHQRRYTKRRLQDVLRQAGFSVARVGYIYGGITPLVWLYRRLKVGDTGRSDMGPVWPPLNALLLHTNRWEWRLSRSNPWFGLTVVAQGRIVPCSG